MFVIIKHKANLKSSLLIYYYISFLTGMAIWCPRPISACWWEGFAPWLACWQSPYPCQLLSRTLPCSTRIRRLGPSFRRSGGAFCPSKLFGSCRDSRVALPAQQPIASRPEKLAEVVSTDSIVGKRAYAHRFFFELLA